MQSIMMALELNGEVLNEQEVADFFGVEVEKVKIQRMNNCKGVDRAFQKLTDLYLWTCKCWYGLYGGKLTFIRINGVKHINVMFQLKYADSMRFCVTSNLLGIFDEGTKPIFKRASFESAIFFDKKRINALKRYMPHLENQFTILYCSHNPYIN